MANGIIFGLCDWPPLVKKVESGNALMEIIPESVIQEFLPILFNYLNFRFPGAYDFKDGQIGIVGRNQGDEADEEADEDHEAGEENQP